MGRLFSSIILPNHWKLLGVKICFKAYGALFQSISRWLWLYLKHFKSSANHKGRSRFWVLDVLLRLSLGVPGFSGTVRKSLYWDLVRIALIFVNDVAYSLCGVNLDPLRPVEKFFRQSNVHQHSSMGRLFSGIILLNYWTLSVVKIVLKHMVHFFKAYRVDFGCN